KAEHSHCTASKYAYSQPAPKSVPRKKPANTKIPEDDTEALLVEKFANQDHGVHEIIAQVLALKGLETVDDFAYAFPEIRSLESLLSGSAKPSDLPMNYVSSQPSLLNKFIRSPELIDDFKTNYPGELLDE
ncbi:unnamed protein product, partial [Symbiodinium microadriaticum]